MITRFFRGMGYFGRGWRVAFGSARLLPFVVLPAAITLVVVVGGSAAAWRWAAAAVHHWVDGHGAVVGALLWLVAFLFVAATAYVLYIVSCVVATAPFAGILSERAEAVHSGAAPPEPTWGRTIALSARGLVHTLFGVAAYLAIAVPLFVAHWAVPALAPALWVAGLAQAALFFAFDAFNEPLHRRGTSFFGKWRFIGAHLAESLGFGLGVALLMMVPLFSLIVAPVALVGGTLLYLDLAAAP